MQGSGDENLTFQELLILFNTSVSVPLRGISQNKLAVALGIDRSAVFKWVHDQREPTSETIVEIVKVLKQLDPDAAQEFVQLYLGNLLWQPPRRLGRGHLGWGAKQPTLNVLSKLATAIEASEKLENE